MFYHEEVHPQFDRWVGTFVGKNPKKWYAGYYCWDEDGWEISIRRNVMISGDGSMEFETSVTASISKSVTIPLDSTIVEK